MFFKKNIARSESASVHRINSVSQRLSVSIRASADVRAAIEVMEIQEAMEDAAVTKIQHAYRAFLARKAFRTLIRQHFVKLFSARHGQYVYKNKVTGNEFFNKPSFLGEEDLPVHRLFEAPDDFIPSRRRGGVGFALIVTVQEFINNKIPPLPEQVLEDHKNISESLTHDYIARLIPENVVSLMNPKCNELYQAFDSLKKMMNQRKDTYLVLYLATHVVTAFKGDTKRPPDKAEPSCYFLMTDSVFRSPEATAASSVSLARLIELVNTLSTPNKTIMVNYAHAPEPKKSMFGVTKLLYPPEDCLLRLCQGTKAAIIGPCTIGTKLSDTLKFSSVDLLKPPIPLEIPNVLKPSDSVFPGRQVIINPEPTNAKSSAIDIATEKLMQHFRQEWRIPEDIQVDQYDDPEKPRETWRMNKLTGVIKVTLPSDADLSNYLATKGANGLKRLFKGPVNAYKERSNASNVKAIAAPRQVSVVGETNTAFGAAVVHALTGICSQPSNAIVPVSEFMKVVYADVLETVRVMQLPVPVEGDTTIAHEEDTTNKYYQNPVLYIPPDAEHVLSTPVSYRCTEPPAPYAPQVVRVGRHEVELTWDNPAFEGLPPTFYRLSMKNLTRNYNHWNYVDSKGAIAAQKFIVRNLPSGIQCTFRVEAFSRGGWSTASQDTGYVCPGEKFVPIDFYTRWTRLAAGGPLAIMDRMAAVPCVREENIRGLQLLVVFGQKDDGFHKGKMQLRAVEVAIRTLKIYKEDPQIIPSAVILLGYSLRGQHYQAIEQEILKNEIPKMMITYYIKFRNNTSIVNAIVFLQQCLTVDIAIIPEEETLGTAVSLLTND